MKILNYIGALVGAALIFSCTPEVELRDLGPAPTGEITVEKVDPNNFTYSIESEGAFMYNWFFGNGIESQEGTVDVYFPFKGEYVNKICLSGSSPTTLEHKLVVESTDPAICDVVDLQLLTGGCQGDGKTWVLAKDRPDSAPWAGSGDNLYFIMVDPADWLVYWWNPADPAVGGMPMPNSDAEMTFDLNGGYNYTYTNGGELKTGSFSFDLDKQTMSIIGADLVGAYGTYLGETQGGKYQVKKLTEDELILYQKHGEGFCWIFKPKGHVYN